MEVLKARLLVDHLLRESAQPSAIAAICWSYLAFAKHDHDMVNAVHERLEDLLSSGEPLQLNGHGFLGIVDFLCQFNDGVSTSLTERLIEVGFYGPRDDLGIADFSRSRHSFRVGVGCPVERSAVGDGGSEPVTEQSIPAPRMLLEN
ncbi:hypothetical protein FOZ62_005016 [Perkinsus olseni]|uniref:Uncharacterized protein n=1 Tax=Perkinsus olseni TaxID=32597 RepID=A0A7J6QID8_PEROL|nr:hypothetical protein FOZ62_005016 [Perkinsus olseni]